MSEATTRPRTLYDKIWDQHVVHVQEDGRALLYIDRHIIHEVGSPQAFEGLREAGRTVRRADLTLATVDHGVPTTARTSSSSVKTYVDDLQAREQCLVMEQNAKRYGFHFFGLNDRRQGIVHVIAPEQGFSLPGMTCVCADSHTSTHGAFGAIAFGTGASEVEHVLATQTLLQKKSKNMRISVNGPLHEGVNSKDVILHIIGKIGTAGATGCAVEYAGSVFKNFNMEARMSVCNMSIEAGARVGMVAPDEITFAYLKGRPMAPKLGPEWDKAIEHWRTLYTDEGAHFDIEVEINAADIVPSVTWGTSPQDVVAITERIPDPASFADPARQGSAQRSLKYMGLEPGTCMEDIRVDKVFLGSCTNGRIEDLRSAASVVIAAGAGAHVAPNVYAMVVPGSGVVKEQAEAEGLDAVFKRAGFDWREAGCSMCIALNPDKLAPGERSASTSNRNFEGRQGSGGRTHLMSPAMAAAAALNGKLTDVRKYGVRGLGADGGGQFGAPKLKITNDLDFVHDIAPPSPPLSDTAELSADVNTTTSASGRFAKFVALKAIAAPLEMENIDTDKIIAAQFLKGLTRTGLGVHLFHTLRVSPHSGEKTNFILDRSPYDKARILVCTGSNFGCGSSREHAAWSLNDFGIKCIIAPSFGEIFESNTFNNGMLPITLSKENCAILHEDAVAALPLEVDLEKQEIRRFNREPPIQFQIDAFRRHCLLEGLDDVALTLMKLGHIEAFEKNMSEKWPWLDGLGHEKRKWAQGLGNKDTMTW
ncbi:hypothetical protein K439DRAFT_1366518 [Ramaria rubella]|nr:hypothetical protein K439DRAFT_1366518 [Ramaria rubella]